MYKVYIVDDEALIIDSVVEAIEWAENGFELVGTQTDSASAVEEICRCKPDLVFCDLKMPKLDGIELIRTCRARGIDCVFLMLSAFAEFSASRAFFLLGGFDYLLKPIDPAALHLALERVSRKLVEKKPPSYVELAEDHTTTFDNLLHYLNTNFHKKHTLKSLSGRFYLSESYISNLFAKKLSTTLTVYVANLRMKQAAELVLHTQKSMKEIGILCGYNDYFYFCRVFKNYYGKAPSEYKKEHMQQ